MAQRVVRLESATYEIVETEHTVDALTKAFKGAKVVCNTVGPFVNFGLTAVEAALKAGCHHIDTTGEQGYIRAVRDHFGESYAQAGLLVPPSIAYMYTFAEIAAELALETPRRRRAGDRDAVPRPDAAALGRDRRLHRVDLRAVPVRSSLPVGQAAGAASAGRVVPTSSRRSFLQPVFSLPWGGTSLPVFSSTIARVRSCMFAASVSTTTP